MSVLQANRDISSMEFYKNAMDLRQTVVLWLLRDYGVKRNPKNALKVLNDIPESDKAEIQAILNRTGNTLVTAYQPWFDDVEKQRIEKLCSDMVMHIVSANSLFPTNEVDKKLRREYQDKAITCCKNLLNEIRFVNGLYKINLNRTLPIISKVETELRLLKGWRSSDLKNIG